MSTLAHDCAPRGGNAAVLTANILKRACSSYLGSRANVLRLPCCKEPRELFLSKMPQDCRLPSLSTSCTCAHEPVTASDASQHECFEVADDQVMG